MAPSVFFPFSFFFFFFFSHDQSREPSLSLKTLSVSGTLIVSFSPPFFLDLAHSVPAHFPKMSSSFFPLKLRFTLHGLYCLCFVKPLGTEISLFCMKHQHFRTVSLLKMEAVGLCFSRMRERWAGTCVCMYVYSGVKQKSKHARG